MPPARRYRNLVTVFFLCGLWHGASWNFVVWGLWHGAFLVVERVAAHRDEGPMRDDPRSRLHHDELLGRDVAECERQRTQLAAVKRRAQRLLGDRQVRQRR